MQKALEEEWVSTSGGYINKFEEDVAKYVKIHSAVACQSGTAGLHLALLALNISSRDEVLVPTLTFIAAVNPIRYVGATPVFIDCDDNLNISASQIRSFCELECDFINGELINKISKKRVSAIVVVHVFGNMANMEEIMQIANYYNLKVIEDSTEALGTFYTEGFFKGKYAGTIGHIGVYSFNGNKIITTGGGGMIVSNNESILKEVKYLSTQAKDDEVYFVHNEIGYNYRMTNLQAAIGIAQLERLEEFIEIKTNNYNLYIENGIDLLKFNPLCRSNYWFYSYITEKRDFLIKKLSEENIQTRPIWKLIHTLKPYSNFKNYSIEKALIYYDKILNIPCSSNLSSEDVKYVCKKLEKYDI